MEVRHCSFREAASSSPEEFRVGSILEKMGWSDETEMLARIHATLRSAVEKRSIRWEDCLPVKYRGAANTVESLDITEAQQAAIIKTITNGLSLGVKK